MDRVALRAAAAWVVHEVVDLELAPREVVDPEQVDPEQADPEQAPREPVGPVVRPAQAPVPDPVALPALDLALVEVLHHLQRRWECRMKSAREAKRT
jgi:hypothetical protein